MQGFGCRVSGVGSRARVRVLHPTPDTRHPALLWFELRIDHVVVAIVLRISARMGVRVAGLLRRIRLRRRFSAAGFGRLLVEHFGELVSLRAKLLGLGCDLLRIGSV